MRHVLLVGATDGIGKALAEEYLRRCWRVCVVGRDAQKLTQMVKDLDDSYSNREVWGVECDVTDEDRIGPAFDEALKSLGQLDLIIYCAGVMCSAETGEQRARVARHMFAVNSTGAVHFLELAAEYFVGAGRGQLAAIGSVAGDRGRKGSPAYGASKAGLHTYLEGLRHNLHGSGVTVTTIKPGWVKTRMLDGEDPPGAIHPDAAARAIADGLSRNRDVFYVPGWWRVVGLALRLMPRFLFKRIAPA